MQQRGPTINRPVPFAFQTKALDFKRAHRDRIIVAHEPGLGKTLTALMAMDDVRGERTVVVCPEFLRESWRRQTIEFSERAPYVYGLDDSASRGWAQDPNGVLIIGYSRMIKVWNRIAAYKPTMVVADECHYLQSSTSQRTKAIKWLASYVPQLLLLSGTPMVSRPIQLWPLLQMIDPVAWTNFIRYAYRYCGATRTRFGLDTTGASNLPDLHAMLSCTVMHRMTKVDAGLSKVMPPVVVPLDIRGDTARPTRAVMAEYDKVTNAKPDDVVVWTDVAGTVRETVITGLTRYAVQRQLAARAKLPAVCEWLTNWLNGSDKPLVVFGYHRATINAIFDALDKTFPDQFAPITGAVEADERQLLVDAFQAGRYRGLLCSYNAAGVGLAMTRASSVAVVEFPWDTADVRQAIDRLDRLGQTEPVTPYVLIAADTIEEAQAKMLVGKAETTSATLDGAIDNLSMFHRIIDTLGSPT